MKSQIELAKEKGIEVGDKVKVVASHHSRGTMYPIAEWTELHDLYLGKEITVALITDWGIRSEALTFPVQSLEKVEESKMIKMINKTYEQWCIENDIEPVQDIPSWDADRVHISVQPNSESTIEEVSKVARAFPHSWSDGDTVYHQFGLTKREYFAAILYRGDVAQAVKAADALIAELNKGEGV